MRRITMFTFTLVVIGLLGVRLTGAVQNVEGCCQTGTTCLLTPANVCASAGGTFTFAGTCHITGPQQGNGSYIGTCETGGSSSNQFSVCRGEFPALESDPNVLARPVQCKNEVPTLSEYMIAGLVLLLLGGGTFMTYRHRPNPTREA